MIYLDTSIVVPLFLDDAHTSRALSWLGQNGDPFAISLWTMAEFSSAVAGQVRRGHLMEHVRAAAETSFDVWVASAQKVSVLTADFEMARDLIRRDRTRLRTPDALHLAIARRLDIALATLDDALAEAARQVGVLVVAV